MQSPASSRSASPVDESDFQDAHARLGKLLNLDNLIQSDEASRETNDKGPLPENGGDEDEEQEFEFRLFSAPSKPKEPIASKESEPELHPSSKSKGDTDTNDKSGTQKLRIRLRSPTPGAGGEGRFLKSFRGWDYYFSTPSLYDPKSQEIGNEEHENERRRQFEDMAVSGEYVLGMRKSQPWVGGHPSM